ncbi:MAG: hypothetical protein ACK5HY_05730 [Parahaliea sp.]
MTWKVGARFTAHSATGTLVAVAALLLAALSVSGRAEPMICSSGDTVNRTWTFDSADACDSGPGNPNTSDDLKVLSEQFERSWTLAGRVTGTSGSSDYLNVQLQPGSNWGRQRISGRWSLPRGFWDTFSYAAFIVHVGDRLNGEPSDFGAFIITPETYSGTWSYLQNPQAGDGGGGLSNITLWVASQAEESTPVAAPGTIAILALGLVMVAIGSRLRLRGVIA